MQHIPSQPLADEPLADETLHDAGAATGGLSQPSSWPLAAPAAGRRAAPWSARRSVWAALTLLAALAGFTGLIGPLEAAEDASPAASQGPADVHFAFEVRPLLAGRCFRCHGPDQDSVQAGLRLDQRELATAELPSGERGVVPGSLEASAVWDRIRSTDPDRRMPPPEAGEPLTEREVAVLQKWIESGAEYSEHWSLIPPQRPMVPAVTGPVPSGQETLASGHPIDRFVWAKLPAELQPQPPADRAVLARRVYLDLIGLPPSIAVVDSFVQDPRPDAYERLVDGLLADPAFGERWGRVWLDLARYADSAGYAQDDPRQIWRFRDWVIQAINANQPFSEFTRDQLAGDLLPDPTPMQLIATAFHRNTMTNSEGGTDDEEFRSAAIVDRVNTTFQVWMGVTMECAQCHNHKYDPITQAEYFQVYALYNNTADADRSDEGPVFEEYSAEQAARRAELSRLVAAAEQMPAEERPAEQLKAWQDELQQIKPVTTPILRELSGEQRRTTHIHLRGNFRQKGAEVQGGVPVKLNSLARRPVENRRDLADWLMAPQHPLTARVTVNRLWEQLFGRGLVETAEDFGTQGALPSHPQLLDWLACEALESGWDIKHLLRVIVTSATYRQSSAVSDAQLELDPDNVWLSRGPRHRLSAEVVRDQALAAAGLLSLKMYGPSVRPPQPKLQMNASFGGSVDWDPSPGEDRYRRGIYTMWRRTSPYPSMVTFDAPSREFCTVRRIRTNTPLQALVTLNDPVLVEAAQALARRAYRAGGTVDERAEQLFRLVLARRPDEVELKLLSDLYHDTWQHFDGQVAAAVALASEPLGALPADLDARELASWTVVANVVLNLDETINRP